MRTEKEVWEYLRKRLIRITSDEKYGYDVGFIAALKWVLEEDEG